MFAVTVNTFFAAIVSCFLQPQADSGCPLYKQALYTVRTHFCSVFLLDNTTADDDENDADVLVLASAWYAGRRGDSRMSHHTHSDQVREVFS